MSTKITFVGLEGPEEAALSEALEDSGTDSTEEVSGVLIKIDSLDTTWDEDDLDWSVRINVEILTSSDSLFSHWHYTIDSTFSETGAAGGYMVLAPGRRTVLVNSISPGVHSFAVAAVNDDHEVVSNIAYKNILLLPDGTASSLTDGEETVSVNLGELAEELGITREELISSIVASTSVDTDTGTGTPLIGGKTHYKNAKTIVTANVANSWFGGAIGTPEEIGLPLEDPKRIGIIHDGRHDLDGHAAKILLTQSAHVRGKLPHINVADESDPTGPAIWKTNVRTWSPTNYIGNAIPERNSDTGRYYLDLSLLRGEMAGIGGAFEEYPDNLSTLYSEVGIGDTTIVLTDASSFPTSGFIEIGDELIKYTGKTGDELTGCIRGFSSSSPEPHAEGEVVSQKSRIVKTVDENYWDGPTPPFSGDFRLSFIFGAKELDWSGTHRGTNKFMFDKSVGAFRAGVADSSDWDSKNRGAYSAAFGYNGIASGDSTFIAGAYNEAETAGAAVFGEQNQIYEGDEGSSSKPPSGYVGLASTIAGGRYNEVYNGQLSGILSGASNYVDYSRSSAIASGEYNWIEGDDNTSIISAFIGSGMDNYIHMSDGSSIVSGGDNIIGGASFMSFIGAGMDNLIGTNEDPEIANEIDGLLPTKGAETSGKSRFESYKNGSSKKGGSSKKREEATYAGTAYQSFIGSGVSNTIVNSNRSAILCGMEGAVVESSYSSIVGGYGNLIAPYVVTASIPPQIIVGESDGCSILGGAFNTIRLDSSLTSIVGGAGNYANRSEASMLFGKDNVAKETPIRGRLNSYSHTTGYSARSNLFGQHAHASGGFYRTSGISPMSRKTSYASKNKQDARKIVGYGAQNSAAAFLLTRNPDDDKVLKLHLSKESDVNSKEFALSKARSYNASDKVKAKQTQYIRNSVEYVSGGDKEDKWSASGDMVVGSAQTSVLTLRREIGFEELMSADEPEVVLMSKDGSEGTKSRSAGYEARQVTTFELSREASPRYLLFNRNLKRSEVGVPDTWTKKYVFDKWYASTGGLDDRKPLKDYLGNLIPPGEDMSAEGHLPYYNAGSQWLSISPAYLRENFGIPTIGFVKISWPRMDDWLNMPITVRSLDGDTVIPRLRRRTLGLAWRGEISIAEIDPKNWGATPSEVSSDLTDRSGHVITEEVILHPCPEGTYFRKNDGREVLISREMETRAIAGGDGYWYRELADSVYAFYYRCVDMEFDLNLPGLGDESGGVQKIDSFEEVVVGDNTPPIIYKFMSKNPNEVPVAGTSFELYLSDPDLAEVMEIDPFSVWAFTVTAIVTSHNHWAPVPASWHWLFGTPKGAWMTATLKASGGIAYPGLVDAGEPGSADLTSAVVYSNSFNGFDETTYESGSPMIGVNLPIEVSRATSPNNYMDNFMGADLDPNWSLIIDAGSTSVPEGSMPIIAPHRDYLRLRLRTPVPCRVVARVELTQISGNQGFVDMGRVEITKGKGGGKKVNKIITKLSDAINDSSDPNLLHVDLDGLKSRLGGKTLKQLSGVEITELSAANDTVTGAFKKADIDINSVDSDDIYTANAKKDSGLSLKDITIQEYQVAANEALVLKKGGPVLLEQMYEQTNKADIQKAVVTLEERSSGVTSGLYDGVTASQTNTVTLQSKSGAGGGVATADVTSLSLNSDGYLEIKDSGGVTLLVSEQKLKTGISDNVTFVIPVDDNRAEQFTGVTSKESLGTYVTTLDLERGSVTLGTAFRDVVDGESQVFETNEATAEFSSDMAARTFKALEDVSGVQVLYDDSSKTTVSGNSVRGVSKFTSAEKIQIDSSGNIFTQAKIDEKNALEALNKLKSNIDKQNSAAAPSKSSAATSTKEAQERAAGLNTSTKSSSGNTEDY